MKVEKQTLDNHHAKITVEVEPEEIDNAKQRAARKLANRVKIPGFRPGKAPYHIIERTLGKEAIEEQAYELIGEEVYPKALDETGLKPYAPAEFKPPTEQAPTIFEFTFPLEANVDLGEYQSVRIPYELPPTNEEEVQKTLDDLRDRNALIEPVERAAQLGDEITIKLSGKRTQPEGETDPVLVSERSQTILIKAEDDPNEWPFPGFAKQLVGLSAGEEKTITFTFPDDSVYPSLRGKEAEYQVVVEQVKSRTLPELNDEFAKSIGDFETLQALQDTIREGLKSQAKANYEAEYGEKVLEKIIEGATIQYPPEMVGDQVTASVERFKNQLAEQGQELDTYLKLRNMDVEKLREQYTPQAETTIKRSVVMYELAEVESIKVERDEMENEAMRALNDLSRYVTQERFNRMTKDRNFISQLGRNASVDVLSRKTFERLTEIAKGESVAGETPDANTASDNPVASEIATGEEAKSEDAATETTEGGATIPTPISAQETQPKTDTASVPDDSQIEKPDATDVSVTESEQQEGK